MLDKKEYDQIQRYLKTDEISNQYLFDALKIKDASKNLRSKDCNIKDTIVLNRSMADMGVSFQSNVD